MWIIQKIHPAGIYRNVWLVELSPVHIAHWGINITTPEITDKAGTVRIRTQIENPGSASDVSLRTAIKNDTGEIVATTDTAMTGNAEIDQTVTVDKPMLWGPGTPVLFSVVSEVRMNGETVDIQKTTFGFRTLEFNPDKGFFVNGKNLKMNGVCMHHVLGPLGSAVNSVALERQLTILQEMGCNAIHTSHNPPTPELLDLADEMGFLVLDEAFDEWKDSKMGNGYHNLYDAWVGIGIHGVSAIGVEFAGDGRTRIQRRTAQANTIPTAHAFEISSTILAVQ